MGGGRGKSRGEIFRGGVFEWKQAQKAKKYSVEVEGKWKRWKLKSLKVTINTQQINHNKYCYALIYKTSIRKSSIKICYFFASSDERLFRFLRKLNARIRKNRNIKTHQKHIEVL